MIDTPADSSTRDARKPSGIVVRIFGALIPDSVGELIDISDGVLRIRCERRVPNGAVARISLDQIQISGTVLGCMPMGEDWGVSVALSFSRRREARISCTGKVTAGVLSVHGTRSYEASLVDVSPSGLSLRLPVPVKMAARIYVETESEMLLGEVRHCQPTGGGEFIVGVMLIEVVKDARAEGQFASLWGNMRRRLGFGPGSQKPSGGRPEEESNRGTN
ncbi:MAG TPA: PilZ domain-containing protein [Bryobacteraceae bacterium]|nr:PilZ domain-containing protein [Bryobacteraceae bacterium]